MIGKMHNRITFKSKTSVSDSAGGFVNTLVDYYTCWAEIFKDSQNKTDIAGKDNLANDITFRIRYTESKVLDNKLVISYKSKLYMINSVINEYDKNKHYLVGCSTLK